MAIRAFTVFYAWQSDTPLLYNKTLIRTALEVAAQRINDGRKFPGLKVVIDADTENVLGSPHVSDTILRKIAKADVFAPDLTFVAKTDAGKLIPNPNVMIEWGYALRALTFEAMLPVMNVHHGLPENLPFDMHHMRHPVQYSLAPNAPNAERRRERANLADELTDILQLMVAAGAKKAREAKPYQPVVAARPPAFFFNAQDDLVTFEPGDPPLRFNRSKAVYIRLHPTYNDQPWVGNAGAKRLIHKFFPMARLINPYSAENDFGAITQSGMGEGIRALTQVFQSGEVWGITEEPFRAGTPPLLVAVNVEGVLASALSNYLKVYDEDFKFEPPFTLELGATGLQGALLAYPGTDRWKTGEYSKAFKQDSFSWTTQLVSFDESEWQAALLEFCRQFYDLVGKERTEMFTQAHIEEFRLLPLV